MCKTLFTLLFFAFSFAYPQIHAEELKSLTVNIISHSLTNGAGKEVDVSIIKNELERLGHQVNLCDYNKVDNISPADINLFLAQFKPNWFSKARLNWFIPNAEFCQATLGELQKFDLILCKTAESLRIFEPLCKETTYLGFTSIDRHDPSVSKNFSKLLHVAGKSKFKGTEKVLKAWRSNPRLPSLIVIRHHPKSRQKSYLFGMPKTLKLINERVSNHSLLLMQNECGIHICTSETEGFGHYIMEAMSAGAVVVTTDAPPMNEFIKDERCLVKYSHKGKKEYADTYFVDEIALVNTVKGLQQLSSKKLKKIGERNREEYFRRTAEFKQKFEDLMNKTVEDLNERAL